jgi:hypothetical protein
VTDDDGEPVTDQPHHMDEEPLISLHAVTGVRTDDTMQVCVQVGDKTFTVLIDTGSTHNFFSPQAAQTAKLSFNQTLVHRSWLPMDIAFLAVA